MLQIDPIFTFAIGCSLATAACDGLKATNFRTQNKFFVFTLLYLSLIFTPLNAYMLWEHTGFETLFYYDASMHGIWLAANTHLNTLCGTIGFMVGRKLVRTDMELTAYSVWIGAYTIMLAVINSHYDRFFYPGGIRDFTLDKKYSLAEFATSDLFKTLAVSMTLITLPVFYAQIYWPREEGYLTKARKSLIKWHCVRSFTKQGLLAVFLFSMCKLAGVTPPTWGWDRLAAIAVGQIVYGIFLLLPIFLMSTRYVVTKKIDLRRTRQNQLTRAHRRPSRNGTSSDQTADYHSENVEAQVTSENGEDEVTSSKDE